MSMHGGGSRIGARVSSADFEAQNPGVDVLPISYDGSSTLATQIIEGAAVDVFAAALVALAIPAQSSS